MYNMNSPEEANEGTPTNANELKCSDTRMIFAMRRNDGSDIKLLYQGSYFREKTRNSSKYLRCAVHTILSEFDWTNMGIQ